jgi:nitroreductase
MTVMEAIYQRRSVRAYTNQPVSREMLETVMQAAVQAPTGMNTQPWAFGVLEGAALLKSFSDRTKAYMLASLEQFPSLERYRDYFTNPAVDIFYGAPAVIIIYAKPGGVTAETDCTLAAGNLMLAAFEQGLGTCWMGFLGFLLNLPDVKRELGIPEEYRAIAPLAIGYPEQPMAPVEKAAPEVLYWQG